MRKFLKKRQFYLSSILKQFICLSSPKYFRAPAHTTCYATTIHLPASHTTTATTHHQPKTQHQPRWQRADRAQTLVAQTLVLRPRSHCRSQLRLCAPLHVRPHVVPRPRSVPRPQPPRTATRHARRAARVCLLSLVFNIRRHCYFRLSLGIAAGAPRSRGPVPRLGREPSPVRPCALPRPWPRPPHAGAPPVAIMVCFYFCTYYIAHFFPLLLLFFSQ